MRPGSFTCRGLWWWPPTPYDAKGLLKAAIHDDNPVVYLEHKALFGIEGPVPEEYLVPIGLADVKRPGRDTTIVAYSIMVYKALEAAERLAGSGVGVEVVDLRTLVPLDYGGHRRVGSENSPGCGGPRGLSAGRIRSRSGGHHR